MNNRLNKKITITLPTTKNVNEKMTNEETTKYQNFILKEFTKMFGGCTSNSGKGCYYSTDKKEYIYEDVHDIYSNCTYKDMIAYKKIILKLCKWLNNKLKQECIKLEYNNNIYFIDNNTILSDIK